MAIEHTKLFHSKVLQNLPKLVKNLPKDYKTFDLNGLVLRKKLFET
jgi:hypothetical protein